MPGGIYRDWRRMAGGLDPVVAAYFAAGSITNSTEKAAVRTLIASLKSAGIYTKMDAMWLCSPTSATAAKLNFFNLATPMTNYGTGPTYGANGITFNGTTDSLNMNFKPSQMVKGSQFNSHISVYTREVLTTALTGNQVPMGVYQTTTDYSGTFLQDGASPFNIQCAQNNKYTFGWFGTVYSITPVAESAGLFLTSRTANNSIASYLNNQSLGTASTVATANLGTLNYHLGAWNADNTDNSFFKGTIAFASAGAGLNATESAALTTAVEAYQTALSRPYLRRKLFAVGPFAGLTPPNVSSLSIATDPVSWDYPGGTEAAPLMFRQLTLTTGNYRSYSNSGAQFFWADEIIFAGGTLDCSAPYPGNDGYFDGTHYNGGQGADGAGGGGGGSATDTAGNPQYGGTGGQGGNAGSIGPSDGIAIPGIGGQGSFASYSFTYGNGGDGGTLGSASGGSGANGKGGGGGGGGAGLDGGTGGGGGGGAGADLVSIVANVITHSFATDINCNGSSGGNGTGDYQLGGMGGGGVIFEAAQQYTNGIGSNSVGGGNPGTLNYQVIESDGVTLHPYP